RDAEALRQSSDLRVAVDCELVVKGQASPGARVRVKEEPIRLKEDGTFSIRYRLPERRHVFPVVATTADGSETRTVVLAVDRNTKTLDPVFRDEEPEE
ncbi:MAG: Rho termination protein, partial [Thermoguttaceae bacterium]|nr:Rho termination protein [Thermoguttaceae bacterium]